ncbi:hypothetical protein Emed_002702 [Eimeria media]
MQRNTGGNRTPTHTVTEAPVWTHRRGEDRHHQAAGRSNRRQTSTADSGRARWAVNKCDGRLAGTDRPRADMACNGQEQRATDGHGQAAGKHCGQRASATGNGQTRRATGKCDGRRANAGGQRTRATADGRTRTGPGHSRRAAGERDGRRANTDGPRASTAGCEQTQRTTT